MAPIHYISRSAPWRAARRVAAAGALAAVVAAPLAIAPAGAALKSLAVVKTHKVSAFGTILETTQGLPVYTLKTDHKNKSTCTGACAAAWPAVTVPAGDAPVGVAGLGSFMRSNGTHQVTLHGRPLYTFSGDTKGKVTGNSSNGFSVVVIKAASSPPATTTTVYTGGGYGY
ncbi:MAG: hypothetical protein ACHQFZ_00035 [Acidimicrobiales bacterium]